MPLRDLVEQRLYEEMDEEEADDLMEFISDGEDDQLNEEEDMDRSFPDTVFVCNLPKVAPEKFGKLEKVLKERFLSKHNCTDSYMPMNSETNLTDGYLIARFPSKQDADSAVENLNGVALDKSHTLKLVKMDDFDNITSRSEEFRARSTIQRCSRVEQRDWLKDPQVREQFLLRHGQSTEIFWHDTLAGEPQLYYAGEREAPKIWCDWKVEWSPQGSYITTFHKQGINLWSGYQFQKWKVRFPHEGVKHAQFSPNEEFLLTWNGTAPQDGDESAVKVFQVLTGEVKWKSRTPTHSPIGDATAKENWTNFPQFLWSPDGKYLAEMRNETTIFVRDTETFSAITDEKGQARSLKYENLATFQWSPKANIISLWTKENDNNPARLVLVEIPSRRELTSRSRTQVEAKLFWQSEGAYLCLMSTKVKAGKTGKIAPGATNLEIIRMREKNYPVDTVEIKDTVKTFAWETGGSRFGVITTDADGHRPQLLMYLLGSDKCTQVASIALPVASSYTNIFWAPLGQYFVLAGMGAGTNGDLLFGGLMPDNKLEILHKEDHFMLTHVEWDPSSRYVITAVTQVMRDDLGFRYQMEAGYAIFTFQGRKLVGTIQKEKLYAIHWRPHPPSLLDEKAQADVKKNIKQFSKRYDALDDQAKDAARQAFNKDREERRSAFKAILDRIEDKKIEKEDENGWAEALEEAMSGVKWDSVVDVIEEELDATEELIQ
jgi:translation initiation factor 3 subunit B|mmetsp:Transcript_104720/g.165301  ORF Transcript_104720/g.165301 Transcript_104720/m.165301 type:complete len:717 (+) Transcript_104720:98-2248(+)|eukprot:CAMPEP_0169156216 /NCGR_PEP_ID=MMETSP1015-20121227/53855_1 /TAXON_ID=342587 /ORGANISM="Karlodinium micrum, Strain CCMP2283" /LENGTH=716 /DNA_ID=CAMNT_0009226915 /DNA_START=96 /DNA_END=2246 /DNA_ORIENTATION=+